MRANKQGINHGWRAMAGVMPTVFVLVAGAGSLAGCGSPPDADADVGDTTDTLTAALETAGVGERSDHGSLPNQRPSFDPLGFSSTFSVEGKIALGGAFFKDLGANDRTCGTCHRTSEGWTVSAVNNQMRFFFSRG